MADGEREFVRWLQERTAGGAAEVALCIGDDMAMLSPALAPVLVTADMLLDGVHFDTARQSLADIGRKALACSLSDCAAMAVRPVAAVASVALPRTWSQDQARALLEGLVTMGTAWGCPLIGGDTTSWPQPLAIDVVVLAVPYPGITPVRRDGARVGDGVFVTGPLGGSLLGRHLTFTPRVTEARVLAERLGPRLHAMMDISDGLGIDLSRMAEASRVGAVLEEAAVLAVASDDARRLADADGRPVLEHVLGDGEDFELLLAADLDAGLAGELGLRRVGCITERGELRLRTAEGTERPLPPIGYQHL